MNRVMINYPAAEKRQWENRAELPTAIQNPAEQWDVDLLSPV
jgi:hypothetical protein